MPAVDLDKMDELKRVWTDRYVLAKAERPELLPQDGTMVACHGVEEGRIPIRIAA